MKQEILNVLFLCTGNSARSILAESILNSIGKNKFKAYSAGSHPTGRVNPRVLELLAKNRLSAEGLRSKDWNEFFKPGAPFLHFVFTVCDQAAAEPCPVWPGQPMTVHWGVTDPAAVQGSDEEMRIAFPRLTRSFTVAYRCSSTCRSRRSIGLLLKSVSTRLVERNDGIATGAARPGLSWSKP